MNAQKKFELGRLLITPGIKDCLQHDEVMDAVNRHSRGDWGDLAAEDAQKNEWAIREKERIFSVYHSRGRQKFWIITEADRSSTTVLLPEEY